MTKTRSFGSLSIIAILALASISVLPSTITPAFAANIAADIKSGSSSLTTNAYAPNPINAKVGDTVTWTNRDSTPHTVTSGTAGAPDGNFDSSPGFNPLMAPQQTFSHTFYQAGEFPYYCGLHPNMVGTVIVASSGSESITLTVRTDRSSYQSGDDITIIGRLTISGGSITQPILIQVIDPEGHRDRLDDIEVDDDGYYSYTYNAGGLMNTDGEYTVVVTYKTTEEETTFQFTAGGEGWRPINVNIEGINHRIEYMITGSGNSLDSITGDADSISLLAELDSNSRGTLSLRFNEAIFDADTEFVAFVDGDVVFDALPAGPGATNTIHIDFGAGTQEIEIIGDQIIADDSDEISLSVRTDRSSYEIGDDITIYGRLNANNIDQPLLIQVRDPEQMAGIKDGRVRVDQVNVAADGSYTYTFRAGGMMTIDGTYTVIVSYKTTQASTTFRFNTIGDENTEYNLEVRTDQSSYNAGETASIVIELSGDDVSDQNVAVSVIDSAGSSVISRTVTTDDDGSASVSFRIADGSPTGTYRVITTASIHGNNLESESRFTVQAESSGISIVSLQATDQQGNTVSSFTKGSLGFVKVVVSSESQASALVTVNIFDSDFTSLGVGSLKTSLGSGNSEMVLSFFIPNEAETGQSEIYANVFSDWPASGGIPLTGESSVRVAIR